MSRRSSHDHMLVGDSANVSRTSRKISSVNIDVDKLDGSLKSSDCPCQAVIDAEAEKRHLEEIERLLKLKEIEMEEKFEEKLENEIQYLKDRFGFILQNEQIRSSYMLREAHRDRQEKISALQTQLECKNLAGLMYVLCSERMKSKIKLLQLTAEYSNYIRALQNILEESQNLILNLSRGYKTAARVDGEWRGKMKKIMEHFQSFVFDYMGGTPETNQYFFDIPTLLKTEAPIKDNPQEDPCDDEVKLEESVQPEKAWHETLEDKDSPFVMYGDMSDFEPSQRGKVLRSFRAAKTAPRKWKEYVFHDMYLKQSCSNADIIKDEIASRGQWELSPLERRPSSRCSEIQSRRVTRTSADIRGNMGSILKIVSTGVPLNATKTTLLGAKDSMEIASTTRLREKRRTSSIRPNVVLNIGNKIDFMFNEVQFEDEESLEPDPGQTFREPRTSQEEDDRDESKSLLGIHNDSLRVIHSHVRDHDSKINYEKICPMEKCQRMQVDSFIRSLPAYMRASPFTHFEQTYDEYEACTPEQLEILRMRIEEKKKREKVDFFTGEDPLLSWTGSEECQKGVSSTGKVAGVGEEVRASSGVGLAEVQTSQVSLMPPCTCYTPSPSLVSSTIKVYNVPDLIPIKQELDKINEECFFDDRIEFERFKLIGQKESDNNMNHERQKELRKNRLQDLEKILRKHPSMCEIFQANTRS